MYGGPVVLNSINFNHLYYFYIISKEGSLAKATLVLNVSQPTLSQQLKSFEDQIGHQLFSRRGRKLELNKNGKYIYDYATRIFKQAEDMLIGFSYNQKSTTKFYFNIGITPSVSKGFATKLLKPIFVDQNIGISTIEGPLNLLVDRLQSFDIDFILSELPSEDQMPKGIQSFSIRKPNYYVVCGQNFSAKKLNLPQDLNGKPYFKYTINNELQKEVDAYFYKNDVLPSVVGESDDLNIMLSATEMNHCFSIVPDTAATNLIEENRLIKLGEFKSEKSHVGALYLKTVTNKHIEEILTKIKNQ